MKGNHYGKRISFAGLNKEANFTDLSPVRLAIFAKFEKHKRSNFRARSQNLFSLSIKNTSLQGRDGLSSSCKNNLGEDKPRLYTKVTPLLWTFMFVTSDAQFQINTRLLLRKR